MTRFALFLLTATVLLACATMGCSNNGVEINKEATVAFNPATDMPKVAGPGGASENLGGAINKGKKPAGK